MKALALLSIGAVGGFVAGLFSALVIEELIPVEPEWVDRDAPEPTVLDVPILVEPSQLAGWFYRAAVQ